MRPLTPDNYRLSGVLHLPPEIGDKRFQFPLIRTAVSPIAPPPIRIAAVALLRDSHVLLVRKRGTDRFMLPGGRFEPEETALGTVSRELYQELGISVSPQTLELLGTFTAPTAHEPDNDILAVVLVAALTDDLEPRPRAEIEDFRIEPLASRAVDLAPLVSQCVLPALRRFLCGAPT